MTEWAQRCRLRAVAPETLAPAVSGRTKRAGPEDDDEDEEDDLDRKGVSAKTNWSRSFKTGNLA
ncbi:MAG: hypothetical protein ABJC33_11290, partial [Betaproteobacteria bacterium]